MKLRAAETSLVPRPVVLSAEVPGRALRWLNYRAEFSG